MNYIIYHKNCPDGFTGLVLFLCTRLWEEGNTIIYPDVPFSKNIPPDIENKNIIIIDVAYNSKLLNEIVTLANNVLFIDHHVSIKNDIDKINNNKLKVYYDVNESGASLVWKYFYSNEKIPKFIKYISSNDIGKWENKKVLYFSTFFETKMDLKPTLENFNNILKLYNTDYLNKCIKKGKKYFEYKMFVIKNYSKKTVIKIFPNNKILNNYPELNDQQYNVGVINGGCPNVSLLGNYICSNYDCDFCIIWTYDFDKYIISMRSIKIDVSKIAYIFGGGGHSGAATFSWSDKLSLLFE